MSAVFDEEDVVFCAEIVEKFNIHILSKNMGTDEDG